WVSRAGAGPIRHATSFRTAASTALRRFGSHPSTSAEPPRLPSD
ncbi:MAG: hypothetical protein AVDCRST_MAG91-3484, partial [uncultured Sphingomonadaceae bacterium]